MSIIQTGSSNGEISSPALLANHPLIHHYPLVGAQEGKLVRFDRREREEMKTEM